MNIDSIKPLNNYVLLKVKNDTTKYRFSNGQVIWLDTSFQEEQHIPVVCEVIKTPKSLYFKAGEQKSMPWDTDMELMEGDIVYCDYNAYANSFWENGEKRGFEHEGEEYFFCNYFSIFVAKRKWSDAKKERLRMVYKEIPNRSLVEASELGVVYDGTEVYDVICLNGFVLIENIPEEIKTTLIIPDYLKKQPNADIGVVRYAGAPNRHYENPVYEDAVDLKSGDRVVMDKAAFIPLEYKDHLTFFGKFEAQRVQRCFIFGKFEQ